MLSSLFCVEKNYQTCISLLTKAIIIIIIMLTKSEFLDP